MKVIQCLYLLGHRKSNGLKSVNKNSSWQLAYLSEKGKFWDDCHCSAPFTRFTWNKTQEYPWLVSPRPMSCCWVFLAPCWPWVLLSAPETGILCWLCRRTEQTLLWPCLWGHFMKDMGFLWHSHLLEASYSPWLAMKWKTGWWTSHDVFQKAKMGMCSVLVRNRDLLGSRNSVNLDSKMEISAGRPERTWVLTICIVYLWGAFCSNCLLLLEQDPNPPNTLQRELQCPTTASAMQPLQCLTTELEAEVAPN